MKQRIISAAIGIILLIGVLCLYKTVALNIVLAFVSVLAVHELLVATKKVRNNLLAIVGMFFAFLVPFFREQNLLYLCVVFAFVLAGVLLKKHSIVSVSQVALVFFVSIVISFSFSMFAYIRDKFVLMPSISLLYILLCLSSAWISDSGAYFVGVFLGKTKLAPNVSPKKTVEGVIGGVLSSVVIGLLISLIFSYVFNAYNMGIKINYWRLLLVVPVASLVGVFGDLVASVIKRQSKIKDFGKIMPGHGGVLDRFDSVIFTIAFYYLIQAVFPLVK